VPLRGRTTVLGGSMASRRVGVGPKPVSTIRAMAPPGSHRRIPEATVTRLPVYQRILSELLRSGSATVSSEQLAAMAPDSMIPSSGRAGASVARRALSQTVSRGLGAFA